MLWYIAVDTLKTRFFKKNVEEPVQFIGNT